MAWYRCGGGGVPASLKNDMNVVLNKKFHSLDDYDPKEWPELTNLLGKLPEATVSGSIVTFSDGADDVPTKSLVVTIPPTLSGVSSVTETQTGRNLVNGYIDYGAANKVVEPRFYKAGAYTFSCVRATNINAIYVRKGSVINLTAESISSKYTTLTNTFTISEEGYYFIQLYRKTSSPTWEDEPVTNVQLEFGSTVHSYEPYTTPTTYTANLGRTIYGGTADIVNGTGTDGYIKYVIDGVNNYAVNISGTNFNIMPYGLNIDGTINKWLCDAITASSTNFGYNSNQGFIFIRQAGWSSLSGVTDVVSFNAYCQEHPITLILPLATPTDFTFTGQEINTRLGYNAFWSDEGDTEVTYRADINLALGGQ